MLVSASLRGIAGFIYIPLSMTGDVRDFVAFFRRPQDQTVQWGGNPTREPGTSVLEPRKSFKVCLWLLIDQSN